MNKFAGYLALWAGLFCTALCTSCSSSDTSTQTGSPSGSARSGTANMLCFTSPDTQKVVISSVFPVKTYPPERMIEEPWAQDFRRYIGQSGNAGGINVTCSQVSSSDAEKIKVDDLRKQGHEVVETKWSYAEGGVVSGLNSVIGPLLTVASCASYRRVPEKPTGYGPRGFDLDR